MTPAQIQNTFPPSSVEKATPTVTRSGAVGVDFSAEGEARSLDLYEEHIRTTPQKKRFNQDEYRLVRTLTDIDSKISETRDTGNGFYINTRVFPTGHVEACAIKLNYTDSLKKGGGAKRKNREKKEMDEVTLKKSIQRARKVVRHKSHTIQADRMLTLTFKENLTDIDEAWKILKAFNRSMRKAYGNQWQYIAVPEYQKRGAVHFHLAIHGFYYAARVRRMWIQAAGKYKGNVDFTSPRKTIGRNTWSASSIAGYLSKYISKQDSVSFNRARYSSGGKIEIPAPMRGWVALGLSTQRLLVKIVERLTHSPIQTIWEPEGFQGLIFVST